MKKKIKILDTNVLIYDFKVLNNYPNTTIILPLSVIKELDKFKRDPSKGPGVRYVIKQIDKVMEQEALTEDVQHENQVEQKDLYPLPNDSQLLIEYNCIGVLPTHFHQDMHTDIKVLSVAYFYHKFMKDHDVELVTNDINLRVQARSLKVPCSEYEGIINSEEEEQQDTYRGWKKIQVEAEYLKKLDSEPTIYLKDSPELSSEKFLSNQYVLIHNHTKRLDGEKLKSQIYKYKEDYMSEENKEIDSNSRRLEKLAKNISTWHQTIQPKNVEQCFALDALLDPEIKLVTLSGKAGTGKTLLAIAAGIEQVLGGGSNGLYKNVLISRPTVSLPNNDLGFLPGDINEKMHPWLKPIFDNLNFLFGGSNGGQGSSKSVKDHLESKSIEVEPLMHIRGRSIPKQYMVVDEAQNLTPHEIKTIITRAGEGTKIVFTGDPDQIDSPYLNRMNNGLTQVIEQFKDKGQGLYAHIELVKGERSKLAELAAEVLK